jgi:hypothetical protein
MTRCMNWLGTKGGIDSILSMASNLIYDAGKRLLLCVYFGNSLLPPDIANNHSFDLSHHVPIMLHTKRAACPSRVA